MNFNDDIQGLVKEEQVILNHFINDLDANREIGRIVKKKEDKENTWVYARSNLYQCRLVVEASYDNKSPVVKELKIGLHNYSNSKGKKIIYSWTDEWVKDYVTNRKLQEWNFERKTSLGSVMTNFKLMFDDTIDISNDEVKNVTNNFPVIFDENTLSNLGNANVLSSNYINEKLILLENSDPDNDEVYICDPFLKELVERRNDFEFRNIVFTIQEKQGEIIKLPFSKNIIVQGCAGSGKSMVLFHRLPFLLTDSNSKANESDIYIVTPSEKYIELSDNMRNDLEITNIEIGTMDSYYLYCLEKYGVESSKLFVKPKNVTLITEECEDYVYSKKCVDDIVDYLKKETDYDQFPLYHYCDILDIDNMDNSNISDSDTFEKINNNRIAFVQKLIFKNNNSLKSYYNQLFGIYSTIKNISGNTLQEKDTNDITKIYDRIINIKKEIAEIFEQFDTNYGVENNVDEKKSFISRIFNSFKPKRQDDSITMSKNEKQVLDCKNEFDKLEQNHNNFLSLEDYTLLSSYYDHIRDFNKNVITYAYNYIIEKMSLPTLKKKIYSLSFTYYLCLQIVYNYHGVGKYKKEKLIAIDEAQNFAVEEFRLLKLVNENKAIFNLYGDERQHVENTKGINNWAELDDICDFEIKYLYENYRNSSQIANYCNQRFGMQMEIINTNGSGVHEINDFSKLKSTIIETLSSDSKIGLGAIIVKNKYEKEWLLDEFPMYANKLFDTFKERDIHKTKWNIVSIADAKGLEFKSVIAISGSMTENEKYIAYTRALDELTIYDAEIDVSTYIEQEREREREKERKNQLETSENKKIKEEAFETKKSSVDYDSSEVKKYFESNDLKVIDKRNTGGKLWVVGEKADIGKYVSKATEKFNISGKYSSNSELHILSGWCTKTKK